jgi:hypothetical protein
MGAEGNKSLFGIRSPVAFHVTCDHTDLTDKSHKEITSFNAKCDSIVCTQSVRKEELIWRSIPRSLVGFGYVYKKFN